MIDHTTLEQLLLVHLAQEQGLVPPESATEALGRYWTSDAPEDLRLSELLSATCDLRPGTLAGLQQDVQLPDDLAGQVGAMAAPRKDPFGHRGRQLLNAVQRPVEQPVAHVADHPSGADLQLRLDESIHRHLEAMIPTPGRFRGIRVSAGARRCV